MSVRIIKLGSIVAVIVLFLLSSFLLLFTREVMASSSIESSTIYPIPAITNSGTLLANGTSVTIPVQLNAGDILSGQLSITYGDIIGGAWFTILDPAGKVFCINERVVSLRIFQCTAMTTGAHTIVLRNPSPVHKAYYSIEYKIVPGTPPPAPTPIPIPIPMPTPPSAPAPASTPITTTAPTTTTTSTSGRWPTSVSGYFEIGSGSTPVSTPPIQPPVVTTFSSNPVVIAPGSIAILEWSTSNAMNVSIDQGIGNVALKGTRVVSPTTTTIYTLTASNSASSMTATTQVLVSLPSKQPVSNSPQSSVLQKFIEFIQSLIGSH